MANYCINNFTYYGDDQGKILNLYLKIKDAMERIGDSEKDARDLLFELGVKSEVFEKVDGRTSVSFIGLHVEDEKAVGMWFAAESAWSPCDEFAEILLKAVYPDGGGIEMVYLAEEPGCEIYVNTDVNHRFYKTALSMRVITDTLNDSFYYDIDELDTAFNLIKKLTGYKPSVLVELDDPEFMKKLIAGFKKKHPGEDDYLSIYTYTDM